MNIIKNVCILFIMFCFLSNSSFAMEIFTEQEVKDMEIKKKYLTLGEKFDLLSYYLSNIKAGETFRKKGRALLYESMEIIDYHLLAFRYFYGLRKEKNLFKAFDLFKKAAKGGHLSSQYNCGLCYEYGWGVSKNLKKSIKYYQKAANQGDKQAKAKLSKILYKNSSIPNKTKVVLTFPAFD